MRVGRYHQLSYEATSDEDEEKCQLSDYLLIKYQSLDTRIIRIVWKRARRLQLRSWEFKG